MNAHPKIPARNRDLRQLVRRRRLTRIGLYLLWLALLAVGGVCYTAGVPFYIAKNVRYLHSVFHLWVLAGSIFQFMAVILFVI